jgi:hypothetical protein
LPPTRYKRGGSGVIKDLKEKNEKDFSNIEKKEVQFVIQQIGEPLIQKKLQQMYDSTFHFDMQKRIENLEEELEELKSHLK